MVNPALLSQINSQLAQSSRVEVEKSFRRAFQSKKNQMIAEFMNHPVTLELQGGIEAKNISGTLSGITNLYSFIGFAEGDKPIEPILRQLESTNFSMVRAAGNKLEFRVNLPKAKDIFDVTPMPWASGRSWAKGIETGISGLGYYLKKESNSRSGLGVQSTSRRVRNNAKFKNTSYISTILKRYEKEFANLTI